MLVAEEAILIQARKAILGCFHEVLEPLAGVWAAVHAARRQEGRSAKLKARPNSGQLTGRRVESVLCFRVFPHVCHIIFIGGAADVSIASLLRSGRACCSWRDAGVAHPRRCSPENRQGGPCGSQYRR
jgi:hypothetical protein